jgi:predicted O-methyltransferase YrrM
VSVLSRERVSKARQEPGAVQRYLSRKLFPTLERAGFHVTGNHFYEPVPDTRAIAAAYDERPRELGIDFALEQAEAYALSLASELGPDARADLDSLGYAEPNHLFFGADALLLYAHLRRTRPARVVEIGRGFSTIVAVAALERNARDGDSATLVSIDPFDRRPLAREPERTRLEVVRTSLQDADPSVFDALGDGDLLFVDSSHVHKFGSDVAYQVEHVYPRLRAGVTVHVHDVFSPYHYPLKWYTRQRRFWNEQHYVETMLQWAGDLRVVLPVHALVRESAAVRAAVATAGFVGGGSSFYFERVAR